MANLNVTYDRMEDSARRLQAGKEDIERKLIDLQNLVSQLVTDGFTTSSASGAFHNSYNDFTRGAKQTIGGLDGMAQFLQTAARTMRQTDEQLAKQMRQ